MSEMAMNRSDNIEPSALENFILMFSGRMGLLEGMLEEMVVVLRSLNQREEKFEQKNISICL